MIDPVPHAAAKPVSPSGDGSKHVYDYAVDPSSDTAPARVCRMVGTGKRVLEIGAGPGSITRVLHAQGNRITALEVDETAIVHLRPHCDEVVPADLNRADWPLGFGDARFDAIVAADVLEHLTDPWSTVARAKSLLAPGGVLVVSVPHASHACILACLIGEDVRYGDWGLLDRTHIRFFGLHNVQAMFRDQGMKLVHAELVVRAPAETELYAQWKALPRDARRVLGKQRFSHVYQIVVSAARDDDPRPGVDLMSLDPRDFSNGKKGLRGALRTLWQRTSGG
jgi:2-polyprenyl-3-methyl-5-hydroxy-6-metoxy-1,4-benzoquinol methylase